MKKQVKSRDDRADMAIERIAITVHIEIALKVFPATP
jgi:hypothetical protein